MRQSSAVTDIHSQTYMTTPSQPQLRLPANACDAHVHVFGPIHRFPYARDSAIQPAEAPKEKLFALHNLLGITRCVIVQSMVHGLDNAVVEDAIAAGQGHYLGVALTPVSVDHAELSRLSKAGFRAVRFNFMKHLGMGATPEELVALTHRLAAHQMHLQVHFESSLIHSLAPCLQQSAVPVVIDHMGRVDAELGMAHADFQALCRLLDDPKFHVKVSGIDRIQSRVPLTKPPYTTGIQLARYLVAHFPDQCVWGTDWPHPNHTHVPDDGVLVDALAQILPTAALMQRVLVDNPQALYRF
jgi:2-pyrone-4,6-dicarboxylate lactonase